MTDPLFSPSNQPVPSDMMAALRTILKNLRTAGEATGHDFHGNQYDGSSKGPYVHPSQAELDKIADEEIARQHAVFRARYKAEPGEFLYHGTSSEALKTIKRDGLIPSGGKGADDFIAWTGGHGAKARWNVGDRALSVFVTDELGSAKGFSEFARRNYPGSEPVILRIDIPKGERAKLVIDERSSPDTGAWMFKGTIPPAWISGRMVSGELTALAAMTRLYFSFLVKPDEPKTLGEGEGHPFHGNQWDKKGFTLPPISEDRAPGGSYFYHATPIDRLSKIATEGLVPPSMRGNPHSQNPVSLAPHLESAHTWSGMVGSGDMALLRVPRQRVRAEYSGEPIEEYDEDGNVNPEYDPKSPHRTDEYDPLDEGAELATYRPVKPEHLEVYHDGTWKKLMVK
jgi:hypothetical protein